MGLDSRVHMTKTFQLRVIQRILCDNGGNPLEGALHAVMSYKQLGEHAVNALIVLGDRPLQQHLLCGAANVHECGEKEPIPWSGVACVRPNQVLDEKRHTLLSANLAEQRQQVASEHLVILGWTEER